MENSHEREIKDIVVQGLWNNSALVPSWPVPLLAVTSTATNALRRMQYNAGINADQPYGIRTTSLDARQKSVSRFTLLDVASVVSAVQMLINMRSVLYQSLSLFR